MHRRWSISVLVALVGGLLTMVQPAGASFHLMAISEVFAGTTSHAAADYVELTMLADDQDEVDGTRLRFYDADGDLTGTEVLEGNLSGGQDGDRILIATAAAGSLFSITPDFNLATQIGGGAGKVCFESPPAGAITTVIDCASWGNYTGSSLGSGEPFRSRSRIPLGAAMLRKGGSPNLVDTADSENDFRLKGPLPQTFTGDVGEVPGSVYSLGSSTIGLSEGDAQQIAVSRTGDISESGTVAIKYRLDAARTNDFVPSSPVLNFTASDTSELVTVETVDDDKWEPTESFWIGLGSPNDAGQSGSVLGDHPEQKVVIRDNDVDNNRPASAIYRPKDGVTYRPGELTKFKGTAVDGENESGVESVEIALRKKRESGPCRWLFPDGDFKRRSCSNEKFIPAVLKTQIEWRFSLGERLAPSVDSKIKHYDLFSLAEDRAGNRENTFEDPNKTRFEIASPS